MQGSPRIIYMGTPDFAVEPLKAIVNDGFNVVGVVTVPDKPAGRGLKLQESPVKRYAIEQGIKVLQPEKLRDPAFTEELKSLSPDIAVVVAFRMLPKEVWSLPTLGTFNLHASLLPQYRGAAPINWAVINGEKVSGVTTFLIDEQIDTGNILLSEKVDIDINDTAGQLHDKLMVVGASLTVKTIKALASKSITPTPQPSGIELKSAPKIFRETCKIAWANSALSVHNHIRGLSPYPGAWSDLELTDGTIVSAKIQLTALAESYKHSDIGSITIDKDRLIVSCNDSCVEILQLQLPGKKSMATPDLLRGMQSNLPKRFL